MPDNASPFSKRSLLLGSTVVLAALFCLTLLAPAAWSQCQCSCEKENIAKQADSCPLADYQVSEKRVNTFTKNQQIRSAVAVDPDGNILTVWSSRRQEAGTYGVFAQRLDPLGRPLGTEIHVNQFVPSAQNEAAVAYGPNGTAWIVWQSIAQDGSKSGIYMRRFGVVNGKFGPLGNETLANVVTAGDQWRPGVAVNDSNQALVAWSSVTDRGETQIKARLFNSDGSPATSEIDVSDAKSGGWDRLPVIAPLPGGDFTVVWAHTNTEKYPASILSRLVSADGSAAEKVIAVSDSSDKREQIEPSIASDSKGNMVCTWMRSRDSSDGYDVVARRLISDGSLAGDIFVVSDRGDGWKRGVSVAMAAEGRFAVSYNIMGEKVQKSKAKRPVAPSSIFVKMYDAAGKALGDDFKVNQADDGKHAHPAASNAARSAWSSLDQLAFVWNGRIDGDGSATGLTVFAPKSLDIPAPPEVKPVAAATDVTGPDVRTPPDFNPDWVPEEPVQDIQAVGPDFGFMAFQTTAWQPPDPECASGPNHIVSVVNMDIRVHTKTGTLISSELFEDFFSAQSGGDFLFDPVAAYDHHADRFVVVTADHLGSRDGLNVAVSKTSDPTDGWHKYFFNCDSVGDYIDFENLGVGTDAYYVTADYFGNYRNVIHIFEKGPMLSGMAVTMKTITTANTLRSLGAVKTYDASAPAQYFTSSWVSSSSIRIHAVTDATGTPTLHTYDVTVPYFSNPPDATQMGSSNRVSTIDDRIKHGCYRNGSVWTCHTIGESSTARVRWYEFDMNGWPSSGNPTLAQSGTLNYGSGEHNWFPDITASDDGDVVITCSRSSSNDYPYVARCGRKSYDASGTFRASVRLKESDGPTSSSRWGDYSGNDEDPVDAGVVWSHTIYNTTGQNWRTWVGRTDTDMLMVFNDPGTVTRGTTNTFTIEGARASGSVYLAYSLAGTGSVYIPQLDATLDLLNPSQAGVTTANASGTATFNIFVPGGAPVGPLYLQAIELNNTSNLITTTIN